MAVNAILDLIQTASNTCDDKASGIKKLWGTRYVDIDTITLTAMAGSPTPGYEVTNVTLVSGAGFFVVEFSENKTAFIKQTPGANPGDPIQVQISGEFEGLTAQKVHSLNEMAKECGMIFFGLHTSGSIWLYGQDWSDKATSTRKRPVEYMRAKIGTDSGNGGTDYEKATLEFVGQVRGSSLAVPCKDGTFGETELDALDYA